jgi:cytidylate kinase
MHITITGNLGSGKSTIGKLLSEKHNFEIYSTGKVQRELARQMNLSTLELNQLMMNDRKYDHMIDDETARISRDSKDRNIIFDSRLAWHFVEHSFKVFVSVSLDVAAERIMKDQRGSVEKYSSVEEAKNLLDQRAKTESIRYKDIYNLNYMDFSNYNLIIDSTYCDPDTIAEIVMEEAKEFYANSKDISKMLVSPKRFILEDLKEEDKHRLGELVRDLEGISYDKDKIIKVKQIDSCYKVLEDMAYAKAALDAGVGFIQIKY